MSQKKMGIISKSIIDSLNKIRTAQDKKISQEAVVNEMVDITVNAAVDTTQKAAKISGKAHLIEDIEAKGKMIHQNIAKNDGRQGVFKELGKAAIKLFRDTVNFAALRFSYQEADNTSINNTFGFFKDQIDRSPTVRVLSSLGKLIGEKFPIPMGSFIGESLGCLVAAVTESLVNACGLSNYYKSLIRETEFSRENLQMLMDYGVREKQFSLLAEKFAQECKYLNDIFDNKARENEDATNAMHSAIGEKEF